MMVGKVKSFEYCVGGRFFTMGSIPIVFHFLTLAIKRSQLIRFIFFGNEKRLSDRIDRIAVV